MKNLKLAESKPNWKGKLMSLMTDEEIAQAMNTSSYLIYTYNKLNKQLQDECNLRIKELVQGIEDKESSLV